MRLRVVEATRVQQEIAEISLRLAFGNRRALHLGIKVELLFKSHGRGHVLCALNISFEILLESIQADLKSLLKSFIDSDL